MAYFEIDGWWKAKEDEGVGLLPDGATQLTFEGCTVPEHHAYWYEDRVHAIGITLSLIQITEPTSLRRNSWDE